jgi:hypothetical protein
MRHGTDDCRSGDSAGTKAGSDPTVKPIVALAAVLALVVAGCGTGDVEQGPSPAALLAAAIANVDDSEAYEATVEMRSDLGGERFEVSGRFRSSADGTRVRGPMTYSENGEEPLDGEMIIVDADGYMRSDAFAGAMPEGKEWLHLRDESLAQQSLTPKQFVDFLRGEPEVSVVGRETVRGKPTVRLRGPLDIRELAERVGSGPIVDRVKDRPEIADRLHAEIEVWIGEQDRRLERMALTMRADGISGTMRLSSDILDHDVDLDDVEPPPERLVADEDELG